MLTCRVQQHLLLLLVVPAGKFRAWRRIFKCSLRYHLLLFCWFCACGVPLKLVGATTVLIIVCICSSKRHCMFNCVHTGLLAPCSDAAARFMFKGVEVPEHSLVVRETVGSANNETLMCESDYSPCCTLTENAWHRDFEPNGIVFTSTSKGVYQTRDTGVVRLHYNGGNPDGIFFCVIRVSATELQTLYVGVYPSVDDKNGHGVNGDGKSV